MRNLLFYLSDFALHLFGKGFETPKENDDNIIVKTRCKGLTFVYIMMWKTNYVLMVKPFFWNFLFQNPIKKISAKVYQKVNLSKIDNVLIQLKT